MPGRKPNKFRLKPKDRIFLQKLLRDGQTPIRVARRAQILLSRAHDQHRIVPLGELLGLDASTIWRVCERYRQQGLQAAVYDAPRSGRPRVFSQARAQRD